MSREIPTIIKKLNGNPGRKPIPETLEENFECEIPEPPEILKNPSNTYAIDAWHAVTKELQYAGILKKIDSNSLTGYCLCVAQMSEASDILKTTPNYYTTPLGTIQPHPALKILMKCINDIRQYFGEFGMSPGARVKLKGTPKEKVESRLKSFLNGKNKAA